MIIQYARQVFPNEPNGGAVLESTRGVFIDIHAYGEIIVWPWGYANQVTPNEGHYRSMFDKVRHFNGYDFSGPGPTFLYAASGMTSDFGYGSLGVVSFTLELGTKFYEECGTFLWLRHNRGPMIVRITVWLPSRPSSLSIGAVNGSVSAEGFCLNKIVNSPSIEEIALGRIENVKKRIVKKP